MQGHVAIGLGSSSASSPAAAPPAPPPLPLPPPPPPSRAAGRQNGGGLLSIVLWSVSEGVITSQRSRNVASGQNVSKLSTQSCTMYRTSWLPYTAPYIGTSSAKNTWTVHVGVVDAQRCTPHPTPERQSNDLRGSQGLKRVFRARVWCSSRPPFTRSVEFPKVALLAHGSSWI